MVGDGFGQSPAAGTGRRPLVADSGDFGLSKPVETPRGRSTENCVWELHAILSPQLPELFPATKTRNRRRGELAGEPLQRLGDAAGRALRRGVRLVGLGAHRGLQGFALAHHPLDHGGEPVGLVLDGGSDAPGRAVPCPRQSGDLLLQQRGDRGAALLQRGGELPDRLGLGRHRRLDVLGLGARLAGGLGEPRRLCVERRAQPAERRLRLGGRGVELVALPAQRLGDDGDAAFRVLGGIGEPAQLVPQQRRVAGDLAAGAQRAHHQPQEGERREHAGEHRAQLVRQQGLEIGDPDQDLKIVGGGGEPGEGQRRPDRQRQPAASIGRGVHRRIPVASCGHAATADQA